MYGRILGSSSILDVKLYLLFFGLFLFHIFSEDRKLIVLCSKAATVIHFLVGTRVVTVATFTSCEADSTSVVRYLPPKWHNPERLKVNEIFCI